jgi:hypothetical protein
MECSTGRDLQQSAARAELELKIAIQNFRCTGLTRYNKAIARCQTEVAESLRRVQEHETRCEICDRAAKLMEMFRT